MSKVAFFGHISPKFFEDFFLETPQIFRYPQNFSPYLFTLLELKNHFLDFIDLKNLFFRPKNPFLDFLDLKISLNPLKTLREHLFNLQIDEKNNIF